MNRFYIGFCDYGFGYMIRLFGKDILILKVPRWFWGGKIRLWKKF
jgi:hypothetical protein